jgi:LacI family transcriptional regulator
MVTIRDVAKQARVSVASASRALNGHSNVTAATRDRILEAARLLHYVPHEGARSLTRRRSDSIGVVLPDLFGEYFSELVRGIDRVAHAAGLQLLLSNMHGSPHETASAIRAMRGRVDGLLVMPPEGDGRYLDGALPPGLPAVLLNHDRRENGAAGAVGVDNYGGARAMTEHLVKRGYQRIAHIAGPRHNRDARERQRGFVDAIAAATGERSPVIVPGDYSESGGADAARLLIAGRMPIDAIFCANDMMAIGAMGVLADAGLNVPSDIGVAGFDDIPLAHYVQPSLTTMKVAIADMGARAMEQLIARMAGREAAESQIIQPELVVRETTARRRKHQPIKTDRRTGGILTWPPSAS